MKLLVAAAWMLGVLPTAHADSELPDPSERILRWPLSQSEHPELAPRYPVAKELADPGIDWVKLCEMGAHKRTTPNQRDQTAYLGAWCAIANRDVDTGLASLQGLMSSKVRGLPAAIRIDMANVLANEGTADRARALLTKTRIEDLSVRDRLSALFIDMNRLDDAKEMNDLALSATDRGAAACMRYARRIVLDPDNYRAAVLDRKKSFLPTDPACAALELELGCWLTLERCDVYFKSKGRSGVGKLFASHRAFATRSPGWYSEMYAAITSLKTERDLSMALDVLQMMSKRNLCKDNQTSNIRGLARALQSDDDYVPPAIRIRVDELLDGDLSSCVQ